MRPRISEFSYGFALTRELIEKKWNGVELTAAPYLPSLLAEGKEGGGFDVNLKGVNVLVFLQFKVSHLMTRGTAKGVKTQHLQVPYYRFDVHAPRSSDQHRLLLDLENAGGTLPHLVRYVAPAFFTEGEFDAAFLASQVSDRSVFVAPSRIVLPDDKEHSVGFESTTSMPIVLSEPKAIDSVVDFDATTRQLRATVMQRKNVPVDGRQMDETLRHVLEIAQDMEPASKPAGLFQHDARGVVGDRIPEQDTFPRLDEAHIRRLRPIDAVGYIAWTQFGCQTLAVARPVVV